jgi:TPR repeat protein
MKFKILLASILSLAVLSCAAAGGSERLEVAYFLGSHVQSADEYRLLIDESIVEAEGGDALAMFTVGYAMLGLIYEFGENQDRATRNREGLTWIQRAGNQGLDQAVALLAHAYSIGSFDLPQDLARAECWQAVADGLPVSPKCEQEMQRLF